MPEPHIQYILFAGCVGLFTLAAAVFDLRSRRIPNTLTVPVFVLGWVYQAVFNGWSGFTDAGAAFALGFGILFVLWLIGGGGGGDVKLMGALSVWLGFRPTLLVLIISTVFVAVGTLIAVAWQTTLGSRRQEAGRKRQDAAGRRQEETRPADGASRDRTPRRRRMMAYALPVALATWIIVLWKWPS